LLPRLNMNIFSSPIHCIFFRRLCESLGHQAKGSSGGFHRAKLDRGRA
jgi:hypothetical protein